MEFYKTLTALGKLQRLIDETIETIAGGEEDEHLAFSLVTAMLATALDTTSIKFGRDPEETRKTVFQIGREIDELMKTEV